MLFSCITAFAYEINQQFMPSLIISKAEEITPKEYEINRSTHVEKDFEGSNPSRYTPFIRTVIITKRADSRDFTNDPLREFSRNYSRPEIHKKNSKGRAFFNDDLNHVTHRAYQPLYYDQRNRNISSRNFEDVVKGNVGTVPSGSGATVFRIIALLIFICLSGLIGFYLGKLQESKNYVRVGIPTNN